MGPTSYKPELWGPYKCLYTSATGCNENLGYFTPFITGDAAQSTYLSSSSIVGGWTTQFEKYAQVKLDHFPERLDDNFPNQLVVYPTIYKVLYSHGGQDGDFWTHQQ